MSLNQDFLKKIKEKLFSEKKQLEHDLSDFTVKAGKGSQAVFPNYGNEISENAAEVASFDNNLAVKNTLEKTLKDINGALKRIKDNSYGVCKYCHKEIGEKRLEIRPTSSACVECKKKFSGE